MQIKFGEKFASFCSECCESCDREIFCSRGKFAQAAVSPTWSYSPKSASSCSSIRTSRFKKGILNSPISSNFELRIHPVSSSHILSTAFAKCSKSIFYFLSFLNIFVFLFLSRCDSWSPNRELLKRSFTLLWTPQREGSPLLFLHRRWASQIERLSHHSESHSKRHLWAGEPSITPSNHSFEDFWYTRKLLKVFQFSVSNRRTSSIVNKANHKN